MIVDIVQIYADSSAKRGMVSWFGIDKNVQRLVHERLIAVTLV